ncbi:MAG: isopeptide-forming domain-containing fimbrial protein, partial [Rudaea sp.]
AVGNNVAGNQGMCDPAMVCTTTHNLNPVVTFFKTSNPATGANVNRGDTITYTLTAIVNNAALASDLVLTDVLSGNQTFQSVTAGSQFTADTTSNPTLKFTLASGQGPGTFTVSYTVKVNPDASGSIGNVVTGNQGGCNTGDVCTTTHQLAPNVTIVKALTGESVTPADGIAEPGETLTYTITLTNSGGVDATNYPVVDQLDPNVTYTSSIPSGTLSGSTVNWSVTVPKNNGTTDGKTVLTILVKVNTPIPAGVTQIANVAYSQTPPTCTAGNPQCVTTPTPPSVTIAKSLTSESLITDGIAEPGETLTYTITLTNSGGTKALGQIANETVPAHTTYVLAGSSAWTGAGCVNGAPAGTACSITTDVPAATDGTHLGKVTFTFAVKVDNPLPQGTTQIFNSVGLNGPPPTCPPGPECVVIPTPPYVVMEKHLTGESIKTDGIAEPGETLTYTITLTNYGGSDQTGYSVTDQFDPFTSYVTSDNGGTSSGHTVIWNGLTVPKNSGTLLLTVQVMVVNPIPQGITEIDNVVYETGTPLPQCPSADPRCVTTPTAPNIAVAKALTGESIITDSIAELGEQLTYTITVRNYGGTAALATIINETVPAFTTFVSGTPTWSCSPGAPPGTACSALVDVPAATGAMAPGMQTLTFTVKVDDSLPVGVTEILNAVGYNNNPPPSCTVTDPACVHTPTVNLNMTKSVTSVVDNGSGKYTVTFEIAISNTGGAPGNYTLFDTLNFTPTGVTFNGSAHVTTTGGTVNAALAGGNFTPGNGSQAQLSATAVIIGVGETDLYDISVPVSVGGQLANGSCSGDPGNGFYNAADLTGTYNLHSAACAPVSGTQALISLVKNATLAVDNNGNHYGDVGDVIGYTFSITNTGTEPLSTLQLFDSRATNMHCQSTTQNGLPIHVRLNDTIFYDGFEGGSGVLRPQDSVTCTGSYVLTAADVARKKVTNSATAQASGPAGQVVSAVGTATFTLFQ